MCEPDSQFINLLMKNTAVVLADPGLPPLPTPVRGKATQKQFHEKPEQAKFARWSIRGPHPPQGLACSSGEGGTPSPGPDEVDLGIAGSSGWAQESTAKFRS